MGNKGKERLVVALTSIFLAISFIGLGFGVVSGSGEPTRMVAAYAIDDSSSPFSKEQLVKGAVATQEYSFTTHDLIAYKEVIAKMNEEAATPYADYGSAKISDAPEQYCVNGDAISHLNDVYDLSERLFYPLLAVAVLAAFLLMAGFKHFGSGCVGRSLVWGGAIALALLLAVVAWALFSFDGLFASMHSIFFSDGTWTFPNDSLLITMLPEGFWIGISAFWAAISSALSLVSVVLGAILLCRNNKAQAGKDVTS